MTFLEAIAAVPFNPQSSTATGLIAPLMRAVGHILYLVGALAEPGYTLTEEEVQRELADASNHLVGTPSVALSAPISTHAYTLINAFCEAVVLAHDEYAEWDEADRGNNLKALADRAASLGAFMDLELAGVPGSDPGRTL